MPAPLFSGNVALHMPLKPESLDIPLNTWSLAVGDFDNDNDLDLIYGSDYGSLIYFRCRGDWWDFDPPVITNLPFTPPPPGMIWPIGALAVGDFNKDGTLDLAVGDTWIYWQISPSPAQRLHVMLGNGDGTFQAATGWGPSIEAGVGNLCVKDFNGDGHLDIGVGSNEGSSPGAVRVFWGTSTGAFPTFTQIYTGPVAWLEADDIDGDADEDVMTGAAQCVILRNNGNGAFETEPLGAALNGSFGYTFGELNGDGRPDVVCATRLPNPAMVWVLLNDGTGLFPTATGYWVTTQSTHTDTDATPMAADLDGDGRAEVVIGREGRNPGSVYFEDQTLVFHNAGNGSLEEPPALYHHVGGYQPAYMAADLSQDGHEDVIAFNWTATTLMVSDGQGGFLTPHGTPMGPTIPPLGSSAMTNFHFLNAGDFNNDGHFDLVGVRQQNPFFECTVMLQDEQGWFTTLFSVPLPELATFLALADFDLDANLDMAVTTTNPAAPCEGDAVRVALGNGDGTLGPLTLYHSAGNDPVHLAAADLNGDTWPDLVATTQVGPNCQGPPGVSVLLNNQDGTFPTSEYYGCGDTPQFTAIADLNADTHPDLAVLTYPSGATILLNNGDGTFGPHGPYFAQYGLGYTLPEQRPLVLADANGDGSPDMFVTRDYYPTLSLNSGGTAVLLNDGNASFQSVGVIGSGWRAHGTEAADLDSDGNLDFVRLGWGNGYGHAGRISLFLGEGDGTFAPSVSYGNGGRSLIVVGDFDQDGRPDLGSPMGCSPDSDLADHVGFAWLYNRTCPMCYPDCNDSGSLTVADFTCFQTRFVAGDPYADCNQSGTLTVADFTCFQTKFVQGCP